MRQFTDRLRTRSGRARLARLAASLALVVASTADAQYFGRNKVQYDDHDFRVMHTPRFDVHFYGPDTGTIRDMSRMAERWRARLQAAFSHELSERKPIVFYAGHADFQQTNITPEFIGEATGGFTDAARNRVVMPLVSTWADNEHVLGHELVHVYQYDLAASGLGDLQGRGMHQLPLWLIEGMAEYLSLGREHPHTAMWLRDDVLRNRRPTIEQLTNDSDFFPYRYGHALWAYIGGRWGDGAVARLYRASLRSGFERAIPEVLGLTHEQLSVAWMDATHAAYGPIVRERTPPDRVGDAVVVGDDPGDINVSPAVSPDGRFVAFFSGRGLFAIELFIADVQSGRVVRKLASPVGNDHYESIAFTESAGTWSPDGRQFAFVVVRKGDNSIAVADVASGDVTRDIRVSGVETMLNPAWSPDGRFIAFSAARNGVSDLYVYEIATRTVRRLTDDRYSDIQPAWSPDGRTIAFATDRGEGTDLQPLAFGALRLGLLDVASRGVRVLDVFPGAKQINPQFSGTGRDLYFISNPGGVSDVYRYDLTSGSTYQVTRVATGISGISDNSAALSVAGQSGRMLVSVFREGGYGIYARDAALTRGELVSAGAQPGIAVAGTLPPTTAIGEGLVSRYLRDPRGGLVAGDSFAVDDYDASLGLEYIGAPTLGVSVNRFGASIGGGIAAYWRDLLGNHSLGAALQSGQSLKDLGGQIMYENLDGRWQWGLVGGYVPYATAQTAVGDVPVNIDGEQVTGTEIQQQIQRVYVGQAAAVLKYPFSTTRRLEFSTGYRTYRYDSEVERLIVVGNTVVARDNQGLPSPSGLNLAEGLVALVGDWSYFGLTSPVQGGRYRFEVAPTFGTLQFQTLLADVRRYFFVRPFTLAVRGLHFGRYGSGAEGNRLTPLFLGSPGFVRGYGIDSFDPGDCSAVADDDNACPEFDRLVGSRIAIANAELRIPLFGPEALSLITLPALPVEVAPFADAGVAWSRGESPELRFDRTTTERVPVFSAGVATRVNLFGYAVVELSFARPLQRERSGWVFEFNFAPGW